MRESGRGPVAMSLSFYNVALKEDQRSLQCGRGGPMQANIQTDLLAPAFQLLEERPKDEPGSDPALNELARQVNDFFSVRAAKLLGTKRRALLKAGIQDAGRLEVTVLLTAEGLQLAYDFALPRKEIAPAPRKPLLRRLLGPLMPYPKQDVPGPGIGEVGVLSPVDVGVRPAKARRK
jgi:hypothetical protein